MSHLHNPHLDGDPFYWKAGKTGFLLMHGLTATPVEVRFLAEYLFGEGYTVAGPLLPGHGTQPSDLNRVRWQDWVMTAELWLEQLFKDCDTVFIGGESTGAVIALYLAASQPKVSGVLCYAPAIRLNLGLQGELKLRFAAPFVESIPKESLDASNNWQGYPVNPLKGARELLRLDKATLRVLPQVKQPLFIVQGKHDTTIHPEAGRIILDKASSTLTEFHMMENSSHVVLIDKEWEEIARRTLAFAQRILEN